MGAAQRRPLLRIASSKADTRHFNDKAIAEAKEAKEVKEAKEAKELFIIGGASHVDLYGKPEYIDPAAAKLTEFFGQRLAA